MAKDPRDELISVLEKKISALTTISQQLCGMVFDLFELLPMEDLPDEAVHNYNALKKVKEKLESLQ